MSSDALKCWRIPSLQETLLHVNLQCSYYERSEVKRTLKIFKDVTSYICDAPICRENDGCVLFFRLLAGSIINIHFAAFKHERLFNDQAWATSNKDWVLVPLYWYSDHLQSKSSQLHMQGCLTRVKMLGDH